MSNLILEQAKELGKQFVKEIEKETDSDMIYWFVGSIAKNKYVPGKSDIDIVVIPKDKGFLDPRFVLKMIEKYKKYGTVYKKGRDISLIDCVLFFDLKCVNQLRKIYLNSKYGISAQH